MIKTILLFYFVERVTIMWYDFISLAMFFNVLGVATWFYLCHKVGEYCADKSYPYVTKYKKFLTKG